ncbi:hypothetical protein TIFTF001_027013 [Ficus carica]|uniref:Uncharacterized protein n=1 Tax=Ficus carica TaxID=3494 RepID=A0AA88DNB7_FICCA|nr:hypothetical protein TIFTF001_027013 [Ficus carica]
MYNFPSNTWNVNNDPITSFSHDQYSLNNFQKPFLYQQDHNTLNSRQEIINYPQLHLCTSEDVSPAALSFYNVCAPSPLLEGQNVLAQKPIDLHLYSPRFVREFTDKTSTAVPDQASDPTIVGGGNEMKLDSSHSRINPTIDYTDDQHHVIQQPPPKSRKRSANHDTGSNNKNKNKDKDKNNKNKNKTDRHSKILTTTRPRHRRMRLSIEVARAFFDLQDLLGFERASKTVEWLLNKAKSEIKKLESSNNPTIGSCSTSTSTPEIFKTSSSNSDSCEGGGASGLDEVEMAVDEGDQGGGGAGSRAKPLEKEKKKYTRSKSKRVVINPLAREQREKARERARERTKAKMSEQLPLTTVDPVVAHVHRGPTITNIGRSVQDHQNRLGSEYNNVEEITRNHQSSQTGIMLQNPSPLEALLQAYCDRRHEYLQEQVWNAQGQTLATTSTTTTASLADEFLLLNQMGKWNAPALDANSEFGIPQEHQFSGFQL